MRRCAFLTMEGLEAFVCDDALAVTPLESLGWQVEFIPWSRPGIDWNRFELVVIRSTWDYQNSPQQFLDLLQEIESSAAGLQNPLELVRWNLSKTYLFDLQRKGVPVVPTFPLQDLTPESLEGLFGLVESGEIILKPVIGANADHTFRLTPGEVRASLRSIRNSFRDRDCFVQPFRPAILAEGEYSLFFFAGHHSHTILKTPRLNDFRSQEEHGGTIRSVEAEPQLVQQAVQAMNALPVTPLYGRVDFVRVGNSFELMEFELIEPSLYLRMSPDAPRLFAEAIGELGSGEDLLRIPPD